MYQLRNVFPDISHMCLKSEVHLKIRSGGGGQQHRILASKSLVQNLPIIIGRKPTPKKFQYDA